MDLQERKKADFLNVLVVLSGELPIPAEVQRGLLSSGFLAPATANTGVGSGGRSVPPPSAIGGGRSANDISQFSSPGAEAPASPRDTSRLFEPIQYNSEVCAAHRLLMLLIYLRPTGV